MKVRLIADAPFYKDGIQTEVIPAGTIADVVDCSVKVSLDHQFEFLLHTVIWDKPGRFYTIEADKVVPIADPEEDTYRLYQEHLQEFSMMLVQSGDMLRTLWSKASASTTKGDS